MTQEDYRKRYARNYTQTEKIKHDLDITLYDKLKDINKKYPNRKINVSISRKTLGIGVASNLLYNSGDEFKLNFSKKVKHTLEDTIDIYIII